MKQTDLEEHIIKTRIKPLQEEKSDQEHPSVSTGKPQQLIQKLENVQYTTTKVGLSCLKPDMLGGRRVGRRFKVNPKLWSLFVGWCRGNGVSACHVLECVIASLLEADRAVQLTTMALVEGKATVDFGRSVVLNLHCHFDRYVSRPRKVYRKQGSSNLPRATNPGEVRVEERGDPGSCGVCGSEKVVGVEFFWPDKVHCVETYVCESCHFKNVKRGFVRGFRKLETKK